MRLLVTLSFSVTHPFSAVLSTAKDLEPVELDGTSSFASLRMTRVVAEEPSGERSHPA
ncbi:MAG TPA: hypothetical protein VKY54_15910 [Kiloniellales bacterium]|nr:hypothetical protein [Kiloniellales bacterium]